LDFCQHIWDGHDYVPYVLDEWMADPKTRLYVAEYAGKAVGLSIMLPITPTEWWFQGFRVDPQQQGKQIGSSLMAYAMDTWHEIGIGLVRLTTNTNQLKVQHLCEKHGFKKIAERALYAAPTLPETPNEKFTLLTPGEIPQAAGFAAASEIAAAQANLVEMAWRYARPGLAAFQELASWPDGHLYWWGEKRGLFATWDDTDNQEAGVIPMLAFAACQQQDLPALLADFRRLGGQQGAKWVGGRAVLGDLAPALEQAGFALDDTDIDFIYEKPHPTRP
jgi:GNAT superfamily N-acetyltransferase